MSSRRRSSARRLAALTLAIMLGGCTREPKHLTWDEAGVAHDVLALVAHNTKWAQSIEHDAVLYRIELRSDPPTERAPSDAFYSFYSAGSGTFLTATSDPRTPWEGAEPQDWPAGSRAPSPLPPVTVDFDRAWQIARDAGITRVSSAVLEVNHRNGVPIVAWSITGTMRDPRQRGVFIDALSGERIYEHTLTEPPISPATIETAQSRYRGALRANRFNLRGCAARSLPVPSARPVVCFDPVRRVYAALP